MRIWSTGFAPNRLDELRDFARQRSAPMFRSLEGCLGFVYGINQDTWTTTTFWSSAGAIAEAEATELYRQTVTDIVEAGFLTGTQTTEIFEVEHWEPPA